MASSPLDAGLAAGLSDATEAAGADADELAVELPAVAREAAAFDDGAVDPSLAAWGAGVSGDDDGGVVAFCSLRASSRARSVRAMCS